MKTNVKVKRALIDTPGVKDYAQGRYRYTQEFLEKLSQNLNDQIVELDVHNSGEYGKIINMGYCPDHGLWADLMVPKDAPEGDDIKFSTHLQVTDYTTDDDGIRAITDGDLLKVVWSTGNGPDVKNPKTQLCNTELEDDKMDGDKQADVDALNVKIGELTNQLTDKTQTVSQLEQTKVDLEQTVADLKDAKDALETELNKYKQSEEQVKDALIKDIAGEDELLAKAYKSLSIKELKELKQKKKPMDTVPKGAKSKTVPQTQPSSDEDDKPSYEDLAKAREAQRF